MSKKPLVVHVEIRAKTGARKNDLVVEGEDIQVYDLLAALAQKEWAQDLFVTQDERVLLIPGYMMVLGSRMVQQWEADTTAVADGQDFKFVQVVPGG